MSLKIRYKPLPTQAKIFNDDCTNILMQSSGLGAGKTYNLCMKLLKLSYLNAPYAGGVLAPSFPELKKDIIPTFENILDSNFIKYRYHKSEKWFQFPWSRGKLYCFSAEKQIAGPNLAYCGVNEFSLIPFVRINEMLRRVRVKDAKNPQRVLVGTPEDVHGWLTEFIEAQEKRGPEKFKIHYGSTSENTFIDEGYSELLESMLDEQGLEVFRDGRIARMGTDYFYYSFLKERNISPHAIYNKDLIIHVGLDFNVGKMSASFSHKIGNQQHIFDELLLKGDSSTHTMAKVLKEMYPQQMMLITCDASGAARKTVGKQNLMSDVAILKSEGYNVRYRTQNPRLRKRQLLMNGMLFHSRILINPKCKNVIKDFQSVRQKEDFTKDEGKDHSLSHFSDGIDYVCDFEHDINLSRNLSHSQKR